MNGLQLAAGEQLVAAFVLALARTGAFVLVDGWALVVTTLLGSYR